MEYVLLAIPVVLLLWLLFVGVWAYRVTVALDREHTKWLKENEVAFNKAMAKARETRFPFRFTFPLIHTPFWWAR